MIAKFQAAIIVDGPRAVAEAEAARLTLEAEEAENNNLAPFVVRRLEESQLWIVQSQWTEYDVPLEKAVTQ